MSGIDINGILALISSIDISKLKMIEPRDWTGSINGVKIDGTINEAVGVVVPGDAWMRFTFVNKGVSHVINGDVAVPSLKKSVTVDNVAIDGADIVFSTRWVFSWKPIRVVVEFKCGSIRYRFDGALGLRPQLDKYFGGLQKLFM